MAETLKEQLNKTDHDHPGGVLGTHIDQGQQGITNRPDEESARQTKVVHDSQPQSK